MSLFPKGLIWFYAIPIILAYLMIYGFGINLISEGYYTLGSFLVLYVHVCLVVLWRQIKKTDKNENS